MENGGQRLIPEGAPVVIGELPWALLGDPSRRLLVLAVPKEIDLNEPRAQDELVEAVVDALAL